MEKMDLFKSAALLSFFVSFSNTANAIEVQLCLVENQMKCM